MATARIPGLLSSPDFSIDDEVPTLHLWPHDTARSNQLRHHVAGPLDDDFEPGRSLRLMGRIPHLIRIGGNPKLGIAESDYDDAAKELAVDVEAIKAVSQVETKKTPFDDRGRPTILFERHYFHRLTHGVFDLTHPRISNPVGSYVDHSYGGFAVQYDKMWEAYKLDEDAALGSASWGRFQIMGSNYAAAGFESAADLVLMMSESELGHLTVFVRFVKQNQKMLEALRKHDWAGFALRYNGSDYKVTKYDDSMRSAYDSLAKLRT